MAIVCMLLAGVSGAASVSEAFALFEIGHGTEATVQSTQGMPRADFLAKIFEAQARAMQPDRQARAALLILLAVSMFFTFVCAGRVLRPAGLPREGIRRLLCGAAVVSAVLRTVDGAADAAYALRLAHLVVGLLPADRQLPPGWLAPTSLGFSVARTVLVAGMLAIIAQYFRSARVKAWAALQDEAPR
ncbi:MAG TPA: hypothetical protein VGK85_09920 [Myxococcaceae bacterium]